MAHHPDWVFKFWTDRDRQPPCRGMQVYFVQTFPFKFLKKQYEESRNWGEKSDILRYEILYQQGGVYSDHDANALRSFDSLHRGFDFYCCLEAPHPSFAGRNITTGIGLIGSKPNHPAIGAVIQKIASHFESLSKEFPGSDGYSRTQLVIRRTYMPLTYILETDLGERGKYRYYLALGLFFCKIGLETHLF